VGVNMLKYAYANKFLHVDILVHTFFPLSCVCFNKCQDLSSLFLELSFFHLGFIKGGRIYASFHLRGEIFYHDICGNPYAWKQIGN
jgi:hypothetical protein